MYQSIIRYAVFGTCIFLFSVFYINDFAQAMCPGGQIQCPTGACISAGDVCPEADSDSIEISGKEKCLDNGYTKLYCECKHDHKGVYLNTEVPFVGMKDNPRCLKLDTAPGAPANVLQALVKIIMGFVLVGGFGMIVAGGAMVASSGGDSDRHKKGMSMITSVMIAFALLGSLGIILRLINPNFFA